MDDFFLREKIIREKGLRVLRRGRLVSKCQHGPNAGMPGVCPGPGQDSGSGSQSPGTAATQSPSSLPPSGIPSSLWAQAQTGFSKLASKLGFRTPTQAVTALVGSDVPRKFDEKFVTPALEKTVANVTPAQKTALNQYTGTPACYEISGALREGKPITGGIKPGGNQEIFDRIQEAFAAAPPINVTTYRGMNLPGDIGGKLMAQARQALATNGTIKMDGFSSTTIDPRQATDFADKNHKEGNVSVMMEIRVSKGLYLSGLSRFKAEQEVLLKDGAQFRVVGIKNVPYAEIKQGRNAFDARPITKYRETLILEQIAETAGKFIRQWVKIVGAVTKAAKGVKKLTDRFVSDGSGISFAMGTPDTISKLRAKLSKLRRPKQYLIFFAAAFAKNEKTAFEAADKLYAEKFGRQ